MKKVSSSKFDHKKTPQRFSCLAIVITLATLVMLGKATYMMTAQRDYWMAVAKRVKFDSLPIQPARGNILSCDGQLMVSSLPEYKLFIDFQYHARLKDGHAVAKEASTLLPPALTPSSRRCPRRSLKSIWRRDARR